MGFRFQRSIRIAPGLRINLSKSGAGISAGVRGLRVGVDAKGRTYGSAGLPGTGMSYRATGSRGSGVAKGVILAILALAALIGLVKTL
ncbi:MAG: DUF4236 domain-containing protein [Acidobacteriota bacterium]